MRPWAGWARCHQDAASTPRCSDPFPNIGQALPVSMSHPPPARSRRGRGRTHGVAGSAGSAWSPRLVRSVQPGVFGSHSPVSCLEPRSERPATSPCRRTEQRGCVCCPDQRRVEARAGRTGGMKLGPLAGQGIPLPGVVTRDRHAGLVVGASGPAQQHRPRRAARCRWTSRTPCHAGCAGWARRPSWCARRIRCKIPVPDVGVVADRGRAPSRR